jgi:hypothetical protein
MIETLDQMYVLSKKLSELQKEIPDGYGSKKSEIGTIIQSIKDSIYILQLEWGKMKWQESHRQEIGTTDQELTKT